MKLAESDYLLSKELEIVCNLLPESVAQHLIGDKPFEIQLHESVTVFFSELVDFDTIVQCSSPLQVYNTLEAMFRLFDEIIENFNVRKIETSSDVYMVASGLSLTSEYDHAGEIARMTLAILDAFQSFTIPHLPHLCPELRVGIHSGPCAAGIAGFLTPRYCLFGDTINTCARLRSHSERKLKLSCVVVVA